MRIGRTVQAARKVHDDPVAAVVAWSEQGCCVPRQDRRRAAARDRRLAERHDRDRRARCRRRSSHAHRLPERVRRSPGKDEAVCVTVPDLICLMDSVSGEAIGTETVRYGQRVTVIALPAPAILTSARGLKKVGPRAFGYDLDFNSSVRGERADDAHRHRRRRHQHRRRHDRRTAWCAMPSRARPPRTSPAASPGRWAICCAVAGDTRSRDRRGDDRHDALHQRGGAAPQPRQGRGRPHRAAGRGDAAAVRRLAARSARAGARPRASWCAAATRWTAGRSCRSTAPACARRRRPLPHPAWVPRRSRACSRRSIPTSRTRPARSCARNARRSPSPCRTSWAASACSRARTCRC